MKYLKSIISLLIYVGVFQSALAQQTPIDKLQLQQERFAFDPELAYDPSITSPEEFLAYSLGDQMTLYHQVVYYLEMLDEQSNRVKMHSYGKTHEGRPLVYLMITHEDNHAQLDEIQANNLKLADPVRTSESEAAQIMQQTPLVVSFSYNIHGNEASSTEAAMQVAYRLAAATDADTEELLKDLVFIAYVTVNPDGRDRYAYWYNSVAKSVVGTDPYELEHDAPWPNGRTNHYWFDLNRDWIWGVHPEMRGLTDVYQQWMPQLHVDYHEQGYNSNYFTMPGTTPRNLLLPDLYEAYTDTIGRANGAFFDENKLNYFTREAFDFFYPGYGSSYPSVNGAIGMLTEQGGIGAGRAIITEDGYILTFRQRIFDHYNTSLATLKKAVEHKRMFQEYSYAAMNPANSKSEIKAYVFPDDPNGFLYEVIDMLMHHKIEVYRADEDIDLRNSTHYPSKDKGRYRVDKGSFVVPTDQARHMLINSILQQEMAIEDSVMYDMSTWSAPLAYNLDTYASYNAINADMTLLEEAPSIEGMLTGETDNAYAYLVNWQQRHAPKLLASLWKHEYRVRSARESFKTFDGVQYPEGTLIILAGRNRHKWESMSEDMQALAKTHQIKIEAVSSGRMMEGIDLASNSARPVKPPKAAMLVDEPFNTYASGFIYHLFDKDVALGVDRIRASSLKQSAISGVRRARYGSPDLHDYDVLILPPASNLSRVFDKNGLNELKSWIRDGGTLVLNGGSAAYYAADSTFGALPGDQTKPAEGAEDLLYKDRSRYRGLQRVPGAAMHTKLDTSDPLAFGMPESFYSLKYDTDTIKPSSRVQGTARYIDDSGVLVSGYASEANQQAIGNGVMAGHLSYGQGKVVFIMDDTQYRMFWRGGQRLLINAVMLLGGF